MFLRIVVGGARGQICERYLERERALLGGEWDVGDVGARRARGVGVGRECASCGVGVEDVVGEVVKGGRGRVRVGGAAAHGLKGVGGAVFGHYGGGVLVA